VRKHYKEGNLRRCDGRKGRKEEYFMTQFVREGETNWTVGLVDGSKDG